MDTQELADPPERQGVVAARVGVVPERIEREPPWPAPRPTASSGRRRFPAAPDPEVSTAPEAPSASR